MDDKDEIEQQVRRWLEDVVIGLNLCPFAHQPNKQDRIRIAVTEATDEEGLLEALQEEMSLLNASEETEIETTLLVSPYMLDDFEQYNQFFDLVDIWL